MRSLLFSVFIIICSSSIMEGQAPAFLKRSVSDIMVKESDVSGEKAYYKPIFGEGDSDSQTLKGISRFGFLAIDSGGSTKSVLYSNEEHIIFILEGTGILDYDSSIIPVTGNDFFYIPAGVKYSIRNPREDTIRVVVMGFRIPQGVNVKKTPGIMIASSERVNFQVLGQHGPTTQFQLLMGTTESKRDRLAAAVQVNSLFIMDFAVGGTNIPNRHGREEEIYIVLKGSGDMVAGETPDGKEMRYPAKEGDAYFFAPNTLIGFYSNTKEGEEHARILAVRSKLPR
jgi:mannose-6-phosphate isomerase-like protein (cupin superfamily)